MATVFLARDLRHERLVALKVLHSDLAHALGPERFQREVRLAARLQHPHILTVFDSGEAAGHLWFTMPYVEGESLRSRLERERQLPVDDALRIAREAAQALEYAHQHGVVHRDIKPENLLLTEDGNTLVADFGIARALGGTDQRLTETGLAIGTPAYMSPEQASGEGDLTARSDIYSLGAVLYEMLAGEPPFTGPTAQAVIAKRFSGTVPSVRTVRPMVPEAVEQAVTRALAVVPADRYASAAELARALSTAAATTTATAQATVAAPRSSIGSRSRPWKSPAFLTLVLGFLLGTGVFVAWRKRAATDDHSSVPTVAVLPFENLGAEKDEYFADGMTDEVRGKLASLKGLRVIATGSSRQYKQSTKPLSTIAAELGVDYLLVGKVRWARGGADSASQVRVSPELVQVTDGAATVRWTQPFQAALTDVFRVQSDIAGQVASALDLALGTDQKQQLAARPTKNLAAYDAYLRARAIIPQDPAHVRQRIALIEQAIALDSTFALAWGDLSSTLSLLYANGTPDPVIAARVKSSAERAVALDPDGPAGHVALARYHLYVRRDANAGLREARLALAVAPNDVRALGTVASAERRLALYDAALAHLRQARQLDPRAVGNLGALQSLLLSLRRYPEALEASEATLALLPGDLSFSQDKAMVYVAQGNLTAAREVIRQISPTVQPAEVGAFFSQYWDMYWVLDDAQQRLVLGLTPAAFDQDRGAWGTTLMQLYELRGDHARARAYADSAYTATAAQLRESPDDAQRNAIAGLELAYLGRKAEAIAAGLRALALTPISADRENGPYYQQLMARIYMMVGEPEKALDMLEPLLKMPYFLSPGWLRIDPTWAPLKGNPRFERLIAGT
jgi:serine/threonine-protein kinase